MSDKFWTEQRIARAKEALSKSYTTREAAAKLGVSKDALRNAIRDVGENVADYLMKRAVPADDAPIPFTVPEDLHPVDQQIAKEAAAKERRQVDSMVDEIRELRARQAFLDDVAAKNAPPKILPRETSEGVREMTFVALGSDWHTEEVVTPESVAFRNEYNLEISERRIRRFFDSIIWNVEHHRASGRIAIRDGIIWLGGDLMTGYIHPELEESNELSPTETIIWLKPRIRDGINTVLERLGLDRLIIPCSHGNHGRTGIKMRVKTSYANSYEWLMYHGLMEDFKGDSCVEFVVTNSEHQYVQAYDWTLHFHHGHDVRYQGGIGGIGIPFLKACYSWDRVRRADVHNIGHWHMLRDFGNGIVNGSLIGFSDFSQKIRADFEEPQQAFYFMDSHRGKCMWTPLWVEDRRPGELVAA